ncbi:DUF4920 domain-containing protein [Pseudoxanthomonas sp. PXM03]|uniref:DUF4920 domain-containing protein n=1 Tax=Pseudoxanthomonas sp. PXM03 TaxID=2769284 RepID=UPI001786651C|nr:DUF4920 domain-containing protein [Pseudoxanthomonas sp. PXM03]MBD9434934.1 DUF4920 domain-containing protein [Pseudoxanthomonas sp. PXM03]
MQRWLAMICSVVVAAPVMASDTAWDKYGADIPVGAVVPLAQALAQPSAHEGQARVFSGRVVDVCQKKGCWVMLEDDGQGARVLLGDHDFYVPKDVRGDAQVHGVLSRVTLSPAARDHTAEETSTGAAVAEVEYRIVADGVQVRVDEPDA